MWYNVHGYVPTVEQMKNVYNIPPKEEDEKKHQHALDFLLWYSDVYLPATAMEANYGKSIRFYKKAVAGVRIKGEMKVAVESAAEAYGLLVLDNCYTKWCALAPEITKNPKFKPPKFDKSNPDTFPFHDTKYSDARGGQGKGWKEEEARPVFESFKEAIKAFRKKEKEKNWPTYQLCLDLIRTKHGITETEAQRKKGRKRKRNVVEEKEGEQDDFVMDDKSDDEFDAAA